MINMQELQVKQKDEEYSSELLKEGHPITSYQINKKINEFFDDKTPGLPYLSNKKFKKYDKSDKDSFNAIFKTIKQDLDNAYIIYNNQTDYGTIINGDYDTRMEQTNKAVDSLILQTQILEEYTKKKTAYSPYIINFNDLSNVNTRNLVVNNIPYTTSEIDYNTSTLKNELQSTPNDKVDLSEATIKLTCNHSKITTDKKIDEITSELLNSAVTIKATTQSNTPSQLILDVVLKENKEISRIDLIGYSLYNTSISLYVSEDGTNYFEKASGDGDSNMIWRFNQISVAAIKIIISKNDFDYLSEDGTGETYYMLSNLGLYLDKYKKTSVYTSEVIEFKETISDITLDPIHELPPKTDIAYFVGVENNKNNVEWKTINPKQTIDLGLLYKKEEMLNFKTSNNNIFGFQVYDVANEEFYYRINDIPKYTNINSIELRAGLSQWLIEELNVSDKYKDGFPTECHTNDYSKARVTAISPLDSTIMELRCEKENNYFVLSQYAICEKDTIIENRYFDFDFEKIENADGTESNKENLDIILLINGKQVFAKNNKYTFKLKAGENLVQIMVLLTNHDVSKLDSEGNKIIKTIRHNFNLISYCEKVFAGPPMERINKNSLVKNISAHSLKYFAVNEENLKPPGVKEAPDDLRDVILVKFNPRYVLKPVDPLMYDRDSQEVNAPMDAELEISKEVPEIMEASLMSMSRSRSKDMTDIINDPLYDENNDVIVPDEDKEYPVYVREDVHLNNSEYFRMYIKYKYMLESTREYITNSDNNSNIRLRVMAKLSTGDLSVSPAIKAIKIVGE